MSKNLPARITIPVPALSKPTATPSLPAWLISQLDTVKLELQPTGEGFRDIMVLPESLMPTVAQREAIESHLAALRSLLAQTPENSPAAAQTMLSAITKMMAVLGGTKATAFTAESKAEAYTEALEDVPDWAVVAAIRRWYRGDCGRDERQHDRDYRFAPEPATLRKLAMIEAMRVRVQIDQLQKVLDAKPYVDCTAQLERGRHARAGLMKIWREQGNLKDLTFDQAIKLGEEICSEAKP